jgi:hypothetical protein
MKKPNEFRLGPANCSSSLLPNRGFGVPIDTVLHALWASISAAGFGSSATISQFWPKSRAVVKEDISIRRMRACDV